jgi:hypothetical protein
VRRPTAQDRELADIFYGMEPGDYRIAVRITPAFPVLAKLKNEGSFFITMPDGRTIEITRRTII